MSTEWLDPSRSGESLTELVLRRRHEAAYVFARRLAAGGLVVDVACGVAYGADLLGDALERYLGLDRSAEALRAARSRTAGRRADVVRADVVGGLPLRAGCADLVLGFQVIEHVPVARAVDFLAGLRRLCRPGGRVLLTTPNRRHRLLPGQSPWNPYHVREFRQRELRELLEEVFPRVSVLGLRADEELERVERDRVRQDPLDVYTRPLRRLLPRGLRSWLGGLLPSPGGKDRTEAEPAEPADVPLDRFRVEEDPAGDGLDLVAVCRP